jgi:hypothetical protein
MFLPMSVAPMPSRHRSTTAVLALTSALLAVHLLEHGEREGPSVQLHPPDAQRILLGVMAGILGTKVARQTSGRRHAG